MSLVLIFSTCGLFFYFKIIEDMTNFIQKWTFFFLQNLNVFTIQAVSQELTVMFSETSEVEFKEFEPQLKFELQFKHCHYCSFILIGRQISRFKKIKFHDTPFLEFNVLRYKLKSTSVEVQNSPNAQKSMNKYCFTVIWTNLIFDIFKNWFLNQNCISKKIRSNELLDNCLKPFYCKLF